MHDYLEAILKVKLQVSQWNDTRQVKMQQWMCHFIMLGKKWLLKRKVALVIRNFPILSSYLQLKCKSITKTCCVVHHIQLVLNFFSSAIYEVGVVIEVNRAEMAGFVTQCFCFFPFVSIMYLIWKCILLTLCFCIVYCKYCTYYIRILKGFHVMATLYRNAWKEMKIKKNH